MKNDFFVIMMLIIKMWVIDYAPITPPPSLSLCELWPHYWNGTGQIVLRSPPLPLQPYAGTSPLSLSLILSLPSAFQSDRFCCSER